MIAIRVIYKLSIVPVICVARFVSPDKSVVSSHGRSALQKRCKGDILDPSPQQVLPTVEWSPTLSTERKSKLPASPYEQGSNDDTIS